MSSEVTPASCPSCGAQASGRFCSSCGAPLGASVCASCAATLSAGARFCHVCGVPVARGATAPAATPAKRDVALPWAFAAIALVALVAVFAAQRIGAHTGARLDAPLNALPQASLGEVPAGMRAPDISNMSPRQRANLLYDRVMMLSTERAQDSLDFAAAGKEDSLQFFAQMAVQAHLAIQPRDADVRYDLGRIAEVAGAPQMARMQADSILATQPNHLLGLMLAASSSRQLGDTAAAAEFDRRLAAAVPSEAGKSLPEYEAHKPEIDRMLDEVRARRAAP